MSEKDVSEPQPDDRREDEDVGTAAEGSGGGLDEADRLGTGTGTRLGTGDESVRDVDYNDSSIARPVSGVDLDGAASANAGGGGNRAPPGSALSQASSRSKRDRKKKGRGAGAHDGEPAMSVEDLFVTISRVQVRMQVVFRAIYVACPVLLCSHKEYQTKYTFFFAHAT